VNGPYCRFGKKNFGEFSEVFVWHPQIMGGVPKIMQAVQKYTNHHYLMGWMSTKQL